MVFFCDSLLSLVATIELVFFLFADVDLPRPAPPITPPIAPPAVVITGVTASATEPEVSFAKIGVRLAVPLATTGGAKDEAVVAAATSVDDEDAAAAAEGDSATAAFFLSSAKDAVAAASAAAVATAFDRETSSTVSAAASAAAFAAAASAASQAFAAAMMSDGICEESLKFGCCRRASNLTSLRSTVAATSAGDAPKSRMSSFLMIFSTSGVS